MFEDVDESVKTKPKARRAKSKKKSTSEYSTSLDLPSNFKPYSFDELLIRPLSIKEVKAMQPILKGKVSGANLANALQGVCSIRLDQLTYGDFWFVLAWLRINTFENAPFTIKWTCPKCHQSNLTKFQLDNLTIIELPTDYKEPASITLPNGETLPMRLQRVEDQDTVEHYIKTMSGIDVVTNADLYIPSIAVSIANGKSLHEKIEMISNTDVYSAEDLSILVEFQNVFAHGLPRYLEDTCGGDDGCGFSTNHLRLDFRVHDTIPSNEYRGYIRNNIHFG